MRGDLADYELADRVFAPHYARAVPHTVTRASTLFAEPGGEVIAEIAPGTRFDLLDISGGWAWGVCRESGQVGYIADADVVPAE